MYVNYDWLQEYCDCNLTPDEAASRLTMAGLNVEGISESDAGHAVLDVEVTANRNDCNNYIGVARELSVLTDTDLSLPRLDVPAERTESLDDVSVSVNEDARDLCPRYTARLVRDVNVGPSPDWLVERLESMGLQSVNNIVDITNYVLFETGQPLHAFDVDLLDGPEINVRRATDDEEMEALNDETYDLNPEMLVIADASRPVAIAGIIGGQETEVRDSTTDVLIESALFDPVSVRRTSRALGVSTESSYRFERGPDPEQVDLASRRAARLMQELAGGTVESLYVDRNYTTGDDESTVVQVRPDRVNELLGTEISTDRLKTMYKGLGFEPEGTENGALRYRIPSFRPDVEREEDLVEEAARIYGYDEIPLSAETAQSYAPPEQAESTRNRVRRLLSGEGYREILTFPFLEQQEQDLPSYWTSDEPVGILNAYGEVDRCLRQSLLPSFLEVLSTNHGYGKGDLQFFEIARSYRWHDEEEPIEQNLVGLLREDDFRGIKGDIEVLVDRLLREEIRYESLDHDALDPSCAAELWLGRQPLGFVGRVDSSIAEEYNLSAAPFYGELDYNLLQQRTVHVNRFTEFSRFPPSPKDLSFIVDEDVPWRELQEAMETAGPAELREVNMFDVFRGGQIPAGKKSVAVRLLFRSDSGTLEREQVNEWMKQIVDHVESNLAAELRGDLEHVVD